MPTSLILSLQDNSLTVSDLSNEQLHAVYSLAVSSYRAFEPVVTDAFFDAVLAPAFTLRFPNDSLIKQPEPESVSLFRGRRVKHEIPMLSTDKVYTTDALTSFIHKAEAVGLDLGIDRQDIIFRATPKLDGIAGVINSQGDLLTRGQDGYGFDISRAFDRGLVGERTPGVGEVVLGQEAFFALKHKYPEIKHPRNVVGGAMSADKLTGAGAEAMASGDVRFMRYSELSDWEGSGAALLGGLDGIVAAIKLFDYCLTDGIIFEVVDERIKQAMGSTSHHHRWQVALKERGDTALTTVTAIHVSVGRSGTITPVIEYEPVSLSGAVLSRTTGFSVGRLNEQRINVGSRILMIRSGSVIPHLLSVESPAEEAFVITHCPSCETLLVEEDIHMRCPNDLGCPSQSSRRLSHYFRRMKINGFGEATVSTLVEAGYLDLISIYSMSLEDFSAVVGGQNAVNLHEAIDSSLSRPIDDWVFLSAIGITHLGRGDSRQLLTAFNLMELDGITARQIESVKGFGKITSSDVAAELAISWDTIQYILDQGYTLIKTPLASETVAADSPIAGMKIVFTGVMTQGSRDNMVAHARLVGAIPQTAVSKSTDYLVCGERVGARKIGKAESAGVRVISEAEYLELLEPPASQASTAFALDG